jgi:AAHS family 4-hydroxybenzoate transporter-like MFS transporter
VPLAISLLLVLVLPESIEFLVAQGKDPEDIGNILERISPGLAAAPISLAPVLGDQRPSRAPVKDLFTEGRAVGTLLLWFPFFMSLLVIYFIVSWLPALFRDSGMAISTGVRAAAFFSFGGIFGSLAEGLLIGGFGAYRILMAEFGLAGLLIGALAFVPSSFGLAVTLTFALGFVVMGAQAGLNVQAAVFYPMSIRSTGIGWGLAIGRIGSIVGPLIGGVLLSNGWMPRQLLFFGAVCAISAWLAIFLSSFSRRFPNAYSAQLHSP